MVTQDLAVAFHRSYGMITPPLNYKLLLFKFVSELSLPCESETLHCMLEYDLRQTSGCIHRCRTLVVECAHLAVQLSHQPKSHARV